MQQKMQRNGLKEWSIDMKKFSLIILSLCAKITTAQIPATGAWFALQLPVQINDKWQWHNDAGYRTLGASLNAYQFLYRTGIRYTLNKKWSIATGTSFFYTRSSYQKFNREFGKEFRLWQEVNVQLPFSKTILFQNRFRTEQRWFAETNNRAAYFGFRMRNRESVTKTLNDKWSLLLGHEYMIQEVNKKLSFNQNRVQTTAIFKKNSSTQFQGGYLWIKWPATSQHIFTFTFQKIISLHVK